MKLADKITAFRRDAQATTPATKLAHQILGGFEGDIEDNTRVLVIVTQRDEKSGRGRAGMAFVGYDDTDSDTQLMADLLLQVQALAEANGLELDVKGGDS